MILFFKLAFRNVFRNRRRSLITLATVGIGFASMIFLWGFVDGAHNAGIAKNTDILTGHVVISRPGFRSTLSLDRPIADADKLRKIISEEPSVSAFTERMVAPALLGTAERSRSVVVLGLDPEKEDHVTTLSKYLTSGSPLNAANPENILVSSRVAEELQIKLGDKLVVIGQGIDGSMVGESVILGGIFQTASDTIDSTFCVASLSKAQRIFGAGDSIYQVVLRLKDIGEADKAAEILREKLDPKDYEVMTWKDELKSIWSWMQYEDAIVSLISLIFLIVVTSGILNTMLMAVAERTREFGVSIALGTKPYQLTLTIAIEGIVLGAVGILFGTVLGIVLVAIFHYVGIDISSFSQAEAVRMVGGRVFPTFSLERFWGAFTVAMLSSILASCYPAWKASRLDCIEAIRHL